MNFIQRLNIIAISLMISSCALAQDESRFVDTLQGLDQESEEVLSDAIDDVDELDERKLYQYVPNPDRVRLKSVVNDFITARFKQGEPINIRVPPQSKIIGSVMIQKPQSFKPVPLSLRPNTTMNGRQMIVELLPQMLDRLDYQPLKLELFQSNVDSIQLVPSRRKMPGGSIEPVRTAVAQPNFYLRLKPRNGVAVSLTGVRSFRLSNDIIDLEFPFDDIEAIFFDTKEEGVANIVLRNGDSISGQHHWSEEVDFETPWGNETINLDRLVSVTRHPSINLVPSGVDNPKWILIRQ